MSRLARCRHRGRTRPAPSPHYLRARMAFGWHRMAKLCSKWRCMSQDIQRHAEYARKINSLENRLETTHNLKVVGSNPTPATK